MPYLLRVFYFPLSLEQEIATQRNSEMSRPQPALSERTYQKVVVSKSFSHIKHNPTTEEQQANCSHADAREAKRGEAVLDLSFYEECHVLSAVINEYAARHKNEKAIEAIASICSVSVGTISNALKPNNAHMGSANWKKIEKATGTQIYKIWIESL